MHYFAVLIGVGATTINAYLAEHIIRDRHRRGLFSNVDLKTCLSNYTKAVDAGLLKIMSKMGIAVISSYRGGYNFEAVGLSRTLVGEFFPGMVSRISGIGLSGIEHKVLDAPESDDELYIPKWFKFTTAWWSSGQITDTTYAHATQYLLNEKFMIIPFNQESSDSTTEDFL